MPLFMPDVFPTLIAGIGLFVLAKIGKFYEILTHK